MAEAALDPERAKVERADDVVRQFQEPVIDDPTVFVKGAALGALTLVELTKLMETRAGDAKLRGFASGVHRNQRALLKELTAVAGRKRLDVPDSLVYQDEEMLKQAQDKPDADFGAWSGRQLNLELSKSTALFEAAAKMKDPQLAAFAKKSLTTLEADRLMTLELLGP